ncbi:MAG: hypothetical protein OER22_04965 [Gammaproteobacteria bacterium]|nr:hypothetical protein [Gammaproteobacteria bacterium]MDH3373124.1 hypothetical protein [Gammaproteobacteria bacterium]MDH3409643.1 hypothetical protein [Gammaproteobacteria bacterium]MDH3551946.1 hypothetical protein [Gammaproteobacteria bacterium]
MALTKITGPVSNFREETKVTSTQTSNSGFTQVRTEKEINFRVGNNPVSMKMPKGIELTDGDEATVVGSDTRSGVKAILVRNDTIGMIYGMSTWYVMMWAVILTGLGLATIPIFIGVLLTPLGLYLFYKGYQLVQANKMMAT